MVQVEEELKHQRELMQQGFHLIDKRFEEVNLRMTEAREDANRRFEHLGDVIIADRVWDYHRFICLS